MSIKPLSTGQRDIIRKMAAILVCAEIEVRTIAPQFEKSTGKKYDFQSENSYMNIFLNSDPEYKRIWKLLVKDEASHKRDFLKRLRSENGK